MFVEQNKKLLLLINIDCFVKKFEIQPAPISVIQKWKWKKNNLETVSVLVHFDRREMS